MTDAIDATQVPVKQVIPPCDRYVCLEWNAHSEAWLERLGYLPSKKENAEHWASLSPLRRVFRCSDAPPKQCDSCGQKTMALGVCHECVAKQAATPPPAVQGECPTEHLYWAAREKVFGCCSKDALWDANSVRDAIEIGFNSGFAAAAAIAAAIRERKNDA